MRACWCLSEASNVLATERICQGRCHRERISSPVKMLEISPNYVEFHNVRFGKVRMAPCAGETHAPVWFAGNRPLKRSTGQYPHALQVYVQLLHVTNQLSTTVDASIRVSASARYTVHPKNLRLKPGQSCEVEVKLKLIKYAALEKGIVHGQRDTFHIKTQLSDQQFSATFFLDASLGSGHKHESGPMAELDPLGGDHQGLHGLRSRGSPPASRRSPVKLQTVPEAEVQQVASEHKVRHIILLSRGISVLQTTVSSSMTRLMPVNVLQGHNSRSASPKPLPAFIKLQAPASPPSPAGQRLGVKRIEVCPFRESTHHFCHLLLTVILGAGFIPCKKSGTAA